MIGLKGTLNVRVTAHIARTTFELATGHRQFGRTAGRVRQRPQTKSQQRLGQRRRRDRLRRQKGTSCQRSGLRERGQSTPRRCATCSHRAHEKECPETRRPLHPVRRQCCGAAEQQEGDVGDADRWCCQCGFEDERVGEDYQFGTKGELVGRRHCAVVVGPEKAEHRTGGMTRIHTRLHA